jgi:tetratricopeptide (TPR) repeat protein
VREAVVHIELMTLYMDDRPDRALSERDAAIAIFRANRMTHPLVDALERFGTKDAKLDDFERAYRAAQQSAPDSVYAAQTEYVLAAAYGTAGRWDDALSHYQHMIEVHDRMKVRNRDTVRALGMSAFVDNQRHRNREALELATRGAAMAEAIDDSAGLAAALDAQGTAYIALGDRAAARPKLERANHLHEELHDGSAERGWTKFLLAVATWDVDPARALELAAAARVDLQNNASHVDPWSARGVKVDSGHQEQLEEIRQWVDAHPLTARGRPAR